MTKSSIFIACVALLAAGCAIQQAYEGPKRGSAEVAIIEPPSAFRYNRYSVGIQQVDGTVLNRLLSGAFEILPGTHTVKAVLLNITGMGLMTRTESTQPKTIMFEAGAGKTYVVDYKDMGQTWTLLIREKDTGKIIAEE